MRVLRNSIVTVSLLLAATTMPAPACGQDQGDIATNRPSFSFAPSVVAKNNWQGEFGYLWTRNNGGSNTQTLPNATVRYGMSHDTELQLDWVGYSTTNSGGGDGLTDVIIGVKWRLMEPSAATQLSFLAGLSLPIGGNEVSSDSFDPRIGVAWSHASFFGTALINSVDGNYSIDNGIGYGFSVAERQSMFVEHQMSIPESGSTSHQVNVGWAWLQDSDHQWDVHGSVGLNDSAPDYAIGMGYSLRFR